MFDEMYLQKCTQYHGGTYEGANEEGELYKGVVVFMITGLKKSIPYVIKACPETSISGKWLAKHVEDAIVSLCDVGFNVKGIVADNHSANVSAYNYLLDKFPGDTSRLFMLHPDNNSRIYIFYDNVHLLKNIRNNLFNAKRFVFPELEILLNDEIRISIPNGYISWSDLHLVYDKDSKLPANLRKAPKLTYHALHPGNNKQNVNLALGIFHESSIVGVQSYLPERKDMSGFLKLISLWWTVINSGSRFHLNKLAEAIKEGDEKNKFLRCFADWLVLWSVSPSFCLSKQTSDALIRTLHAQASLIDDLLSSEEYTFVIPRKLLSDPLENRFSQYRQMSGRRFLVSLTEVKYSERILACRSLLKEDVNFWLENLSPSADECWLNNLQDLFSEEESHLYEATLTDGGEEVATTIAGYIGKRLVKRSNCTICKATLICPKDTEFQNDYFNLLSRGGLTIPSPSLAELVSSSFAISDHIDAKLATLPSVPTRKAAEIILTKYLPPVHFTCDQHQLWGLQFAIKSVINIFYNNKQKITADSVRKDVITGFKKRQRDK